jgi:glycosyltransferase involved in cell wall biosynthesis
MLRNELETEIQSLGLEGLVTLAGNKRPLAPWLSMLDVFVLPSTWEGESLALLQAMHLGLPVVVSRIEGNVSVLGDDHPGLFDPEDPADYARLVRRALDDADWREQVLECQRVAQAQRPDAHGYTEMVQALYRDIVANWRNR